MSTFDTINGVSIEIDHENGMFSVWFRARHEGGMDGARACSCTTAEAANDVARGLFDVLLRGSHTVEDAAVPRHTLTITGTADELRRALNAIR